MNITPLQVSPALCKFAAATVAKADDAHIAQFVGHGHVAIEN